MNQKGKTNNSKQGWQHKELKPNLIVGSEDNPTKFKSGETIINKKSTKKNLKKLIEINNDVNPDVSNGKTTTDAKAGGLLKGKPHYDSKGNPTGGIPGLVDSKKPIETEGEEFVVNAEASKKHWKELSKINQQDGNGVPIGPPSESYDEDPAEEFENGGKIQFNPNYLPSKWIMSYAKKIKSKHPEIWKLGGNIFGNQAFENLKRVSERGYWLDSEEWMYIKWRSYVARHKQDFRIEGVVAMLKWVDKVDKGWAYMKNLIEEEIKKRKPNKVKKLSKGGVITFKDEYNTKYGYKKAQSHSLEQISKDTGISMAGLQQIYNKGIGAYKTNPESVRPNVKSKEQWAMARVYSAVMGGSASIVDKNELKMSLGGNIDDLFSFIKKTESILNNGYYLDLKETNDVRDAYSQFPLNLKGVIITYNSGNQKNLKCIDTVNIDFLNDLLENKFKLSEVQSRLVSHYYVHNARRFDTLDILKELQNDNVYVIDRDNLVFCVYKSKKMENGGNVNVNLDKLLGKYVNVHLMGVSEPEYFKIKEVRVTPENFRYRDVFIKGDVGQTKFPLEKLDDFLSGKEILIEDIDGEYAISLGKNQFVKGGNVDKQDTITMDIPLLIRTFELIREDIHSDPDLHFVVENLLHLKNKEVLTMDDYAYIADIEHKHLKKYASGGSTSEGKKQVSIGFGGLGNGTTVWDRNRIEHGDYKIIAHISDSGKITYYDKKLPEIAINQIEEFAEEEKKRYAKGGELSQGYDFTPIQTPLN